MKITSIEDAVRSGPFRRFSVYREALLVAVDPSIKQHAKSAKSAIIENSLHTDDDLIRAVGELGFTTADLQKMIDLINNPALAYITYQEFKIDTPDDQARAEFKAIVEPFRLHKGTLVEPIAFQGKTPIKYRVVAYDDLITIIKDKYGNAVTS